jgi:HTH-type transcriptional regulator/antitoxin HigA
MPATYEELLTEVLPQVIEDDKQYDRLHARFGELLARSKKDRTPEETKLMRLLGLLIEDYDRRHALPPLDEPPADRLQYLLEISGKKPADLIPIFSTKSHVSEALSGKRPISADQARQLGAMFKLNPGYFI